MKSKLKKKGPPTKNGSTAGGANAPVISGSIEPPKENWSTADEIRRRATKSRVKGKKQGGVKSSTGSRFSSSDIAEASKSKSGIFPGERGSGAVKEKRARNDSSLRDALNRRTGSGTDREKITNQKKSTPSTRSGTSLSDMLGGKSQVSGDGEFHVKDMIDITGADSQSSEEQPPEPTSGDTQGSNQDSSASNNSSSSSSGGNGGDYLPKPDESDSDNADDDGNPFGDLLDQASDVVGETFDSAVDTASEIIDGVTDPEGTNNDSGGSSALMSAFLRVSSEQAGSSNGSDDSLLDVAQQAAGEGIAKLNNWVDKSGIDVPDRLDAESILELGKDIGEIGGNAVGSSLESTKRMGQDQLGKTVGRAGGFVIDSAEANGIETPDNLDPESLLELGKQVGGVLVEQGGREIGKAGEDLAETARQGREMVGQAGANLNEAALQGGEIVSENFEDSKENLGNAAEKARGELKETMRLGRAYAKDAIATGEDLVDSTYGDDNNHDPSDGVDDPIEMIINSHIIGGKVQEQQLKEQLKQAGVPEELIPNIVSGNLMVLESILKQEAGRRQSQEQLDDAVADSIRARQQALKAEDEANQRREEKQRQQEQPETARVTDDGTNATDVQGVQDADMGSSAPSNREDGKKRSNPRTQQSQQLNLDNRSRMESNNASTIDDRDQTTAEVENGENQTDAVNKGGRENSGSSLDDLLNGQARGKKKNEGDSETESSDWGLGGLDWNIGNNDSGFGGGDVSGGLGSGEMIQESFIEPTPFEEENEAPEVPRIRTDLEIVGVRFVDLGEEIDRLNKESGENETVQRGPMFRVSVRNNNDLDLDTVGVELIAAVDLAVEDPLQTTANGTIPSILAGETEELDVYLSPEALKLSKASDGRNIAFSQLAVIADPEELFDDIKPDNNVMVKSVNDIEHVDMKLIELSNDTLTPGGDLVITGEGFHFDRGVVALVINNKTYPMVLSAWSPTKIEATVPNFKLKSSVQAALVIVRPDKVNTEPMLLKVVPSGSND